MSREVDADLELRTIDAIANGEDCPDCGATWTTPEPEGGRVNANLVMVHAESCILYHETIVTPDPNEQTA